MPLPDPAFVRRALGRLGAGIAETQAGVLDVTLPAAAAPHFDDQGQLALTFDREVHRSSERDLDLVVAGAPLFGGILAALGAAGAASAVAFPDAPDARRAQEAAKTGLSLRQGSVTPGEPRVEPFTGAAVLVRLRLEGPEREDALLGVLVPRAGKPFPISCDALARLAGEGKPAALPAMLPGDRAALREAACVAAQRDGDRRARAAEAKSAGRLAKEVQQVRAYFEALGRELREQKDEARGEEAKKEAGARLRNLDRERDLRLVEVQDRFRAHAQVEPVAVLAVSGQAARVPVVFEVKGRRLEREVLWFPPLGVPAPPACDLCAGPLGEGTICADPEHDALLCAACRRYCQQCGAGLCAEHTKACACGAVACPAHGAACAACGQFCCGAHAKKCAACAKAFCGQHAHECGVCRAVSCGEHSRRCGSCTLELCGAHGTACDVTGKVACAQHLRACGECGQQVLDLAWKDGLCETCRALVPAAPGDPAVAAAVAFLPEAAKASWFRAETRTRVMLAGRTFMNKYRVWLRKDLQPLAAYGGSKLFGMRKLK